ncbi:MAG: PD40 domain-containing protein, partial [Anaerolineae bacterium]|nr:PD40 domain-containing protein [Anaerolineae bacterium]
DQLDRTQNGEWQLQMLVSDIDDRWSEHSFQQISQAEAIYTFTPPLVTEALAEETEYLFELDDEALALLAQRILEGDDNFGRRVSFRLVGPTTGRNNLFAWDSGFGPASHGDAPELFVSVGPAPAETPLPYYVVVTSTPTPDNVVTAAAISIKMTTDAQEYGTATPPPSNWITPFAVTATPIPANDATAAAMSQIATAVALTTGEPPAIVTATPTPPYVIVTSTPTPLNMATAAIQALQNSLATALPENWVTPVVVTITPTPANSATVEYYRAAALTTGTPTPAPANLQTATATSVAVAVAPLAEPTATATPSPTPQAIPESLVGKVIFLSDREGATDEERARADRLGVKPEVIPAPYVLDPATGDLSRLTDIWPYQVATARDAWSADEQFQTYVKQLLWTNVRTAGGNVATEVFAVHYYDFTYNVEKAVTNFGSGIAYDPVWSPVSNEIALVATESGNDEIWRINYDGSEPTQLTKNSWEWDKHPTWSPDGQQIVFFSNRTGNNQIWIMNKDGSDQRLLMTANPYNDFDPVWVKTVKPAPPQERLPDWRFVKPEGESP